MDHCCFLVCQITYTNITRAIVIIVLEINGIESIRIAKAYLVCPVHDRLHIVPCSRSIVFLSTLTPAHSPGAKLLMSDLVLYFLVLL